MTGKLIVERHKNTRTIHQHSAHSLACRQLKKSSVKSWTELEGKAQPQLQGLGSQGLSVRLSEGEKPSKVRQT